MKIQDLLEMDMGEATQWLIDNQYDFELAPKEPTQQILHRNKGVIMNIPEILENCCWSVICESYSNGDDASICWIVVGYFQAKPYQRVIGQSDECGGVKGAIKDALETTKHDDYAYQYEYKPTE